jgi:hypothetical protein
MIEIYFIPEHQLLYFTRGYATRQNIASGDQSDSVKFNILILHAKQTNILYLLTKE